MEDPMHLISDIRGWGNSFNNNDLRQSLRNSGESHSTKDVQSATQRRCDMKRKYLAFLVLTLLTFMFVGKSEMKASCVCSRYMAFVLNNFTYPMFSYDSGSDEYCTIDIHVTLIKYQCMPIGPIYYEYKITKIETGGYCTLTDTEIMKTAVKGVAALKNMHNYSPTYMRLPKCLDKVSSSPDVYESCDTSLCCIYFESHWDSTAADYYLDSISINPDNTACDYIGSSMFCDNYCNQSILPATGYLEISTQMPPACFSSCSTSATWPVPHIEYQYSGGSNAYINGLYTLGSSGSTPCFSFNFFQVKYEYLDPEVALEKLTRIALRDIWVSQGNPQYITLNLWQCWIQRYYPQQTYFPCELSDCCEITFEIEDISGQLYAEVVSSSSPGSCNGDCFDVCSIFPSGQYTIPKLSIDTENYELNQDIKIMPNPNTGIFNLEFNSAIREQHSLQVLDLMGQVLYSSDIMTNTGTNNLNLDFTTLPIGVYYLQLVHKGLVISKTKFIKK
jgi:hypothetical protein